MSKFITTLLFVFLAASIIKAQETVEVGLQPTAIIYDEVQQGFHVFCFGYDEDFDGEKLSDLEENPSWWFITNHLDVWTAEKKMEFDFLSFKFPFRPAVIWDETEPTIYIPHNEAIKSYNLHTFEVIDDNFLSVDANAVDASAATHLFVTRNNYFEVNLNAEQGTIDTVYSFIPGSGSLKGSEPQNYPQNIFGHPSKNASLKVPENNANEILSIGLGGEIIVGFKDKKLVDIPGTDFTIFENAFETMSSDNIFAEPAEISVSDDGINFVTFPVDYETLENCAGITPTFGDASPFDTENSGGDSFDISKLGFSYITHIKIKDISSAVSELPKDSKYYSPKALITGFDLDAVVAMNLQPLTASVDDIDIADVQVYQISSKEKLQEISAINNPTMALDYKTSENKMGMAILNEGGWGENNSVLQLGYINHKSEFELDTLQIGDLGNHIYYTSEYPDNMIVTVNGSARVLVIDLLNNEVERTIQMDALTAPRESFLWDDKIWTTTYSDDIIVSDFNTGEIIKKTETDSYTEGMAMGMGMVAVSNVSNTDYTPNNIVQLFPISVTGIEALAKNNQNAILYPNPANNIVNIELENKEHIKQIELLDISGNSLLKYSDISSKSGNNIQLDEVSSGTYFVRITGEGNQYLKILKVTK